MKILLSSLAIYALYILYKLCILTSKSLTLNRLTLIVSQAIKVVDVVVVVAIIVCVGVVNVNIVEQVNKR